jgi:hypothetical protein
MYHATESMKKKATLAAVLLAAGALALAETEPPMTAVRTTRDITLDVAVQS